MQVRPYQELPCPKVFAQWFEAHVLRRHVGCHARCFTKSNFVYFDSFTLLLLRMFSGRSFVS